MALEFALQGHFLFAETSQFLVHRAEATGTFYAATTAVAIDGLIPSIEGIRRAFRVVQESAMNPVVRSSIFASSPANSS